MPKRIDEEHLFEQVILAVARRGYQGATTKYMAEMGSVNEVTLFRKYGSKAKLVIEAFSYLIEQSPMAGLSYTGDLEKDLVNVVTRYLETINLYGDLVPSIMTEIERNPELRSMGARFRPMIMRLGEIVLRYQREGKLVKENILHTLGALLGPIVIQTIMIRNVPKIIAGKIVPEEHVERFLQGRRP